MSALGEALAALAAALDGLDWYVFGAQAVAVHGAPRATQDVDVTVVGAVPEEVLGRLRAGEFEHRFPADAARLLREGAVAPLRHAPGGFEIDLVFGQTGLEAIFASRAEVRLVDGVAVPVASPTDLVVMKVLAGRGKDLDDARSLLAAGSVDLPTARDLLDQLEQALDRSDLVPTLDRLAPR